MLEKSRIFAQDRIEAAWSKDGAKRRGIPLFLARYWQSMLPAILVVAVLGLALVAVHFGAILASPTATGNLPQFTAAIRGDVILTEPGATATNQTATQIAARKDQIELRLLTARVSWAQMAFLVLLGTVSVVFATQYSMGKCGTWAIVVIDFLILLALLMALRTIPVSLAPPTYRSLLDSALRSANGSLVSQATSYLNGGAGLAIALVTSASCVTLASSADTSRLLVSSLVSALRRTLVLLYLSAPLLAAGTREIASLYAWPSAWFPDSIAKDIQSLATSASTAMGAIFSAILLAVFVPSIAIILSRGRVLGARALGDQASEPDIDAWMAKSGLSGVGTQPLSTLGAALAPFLVGGPLAVIGNRFLG